MKLKVNENELTIRPASQVLGKQIRAIKISKNSMAEFRSCFSSFENMCAKYGAENILKEGERYNGYLAVYYASWKQEVVKMMGSLKLATPADLLGSLNFAAINAAKKGEYWLVDYFEYVWTFGDCRFQTHIEQLQKKPEELLRLGLAPIQGDPKQVSEDLKKKLAESLKMSTYVDITSEEDTVLVTYLGVGYYGKFFTTK